MRKSKLVDLLGQLSTRERSRFREYVFSPFFNKNKKVRRLCDYLLARAPEFEGAGMEKTKVYGHLFGSGPYRELRLNNVISDLLQLLYDFLAQLEYEEQEERRKSDLLTALLDREIHGHVERVARRYRQLLDQRPERHHDYHLSAYRLHDHLDRYSLTRGKRSYDENLQRQSDHLDRYYFINKLRLACDMTSRNAVVKAGYRAHFLEDLLARVEQNEQGVGEDPALQVYYRAYRMLTHPDEEPFYFQLKEVLARHATLFPRRELRTLYNYALNHCVRRINSGQTDYYREILDLYQVLLAERILYKNGYLTQWTYINIVTAGIRLKEWVWTETFIQQYRSDLLPEVQYNVYTYNLASLYYERGDRDRALQLLHEVEFTDAFYHMAAKIIQLKIYYELDETEAFFSLVEAARKYLRRNRQLSDYQKQSNQHFLRLAARIYNLRLKQGAVSRREIAAEREQLNQRLAETEPVANKEWLEMVLGKLG